MSFFFVLLAAFLGATVNFCLRKNLESQKSANGYLSLFFVFSLLISFFFRFELNLSSFSLVMSLTGIIAGILNFLVMLLMGRALQIGPAGLSFAFQNSAAIFPAPFLFLLFGASFGFKLHLPIIIGSLCVITGLFLSIQKGKSFKISSAKSFRLATWLSLVIAIFLFQGIILSIFQWRALLLQHSESSHCLIPCFCSPQEDMWFMPGFFLIPALIQSAFFFLSERRWFASKEFFLGTSGGILNGVSTFCLMMATRNASQNFRTILFPLFAVAVIFLCNLWGKKFYHEQIDWKGMALCFAGIVIGSL